MPDAPAILVEDLTVTLGGRAIIDHVSLRVARGEMVGLVGGSGAGKTVLLRTMLGLLPKSAGRVGILGIPLDRAAPEQVRAVGRRCGAMFQQGALFSSLDVRENVEFPMREYIDGSDRLLRDVALAKLRLVGLSEEDARKTPAQLSGGMIKRVALARALALDPDILFLDEPTSGLDPIAAGAFDALIRDLHDLLGFTLFMITHDLESLNAVCGRVVALHQGKLVADGTLGEARASTHPWLRSYFQGERGRAIHWTD